MASITSKKKGKYLKKESSSALTQIYLETLDSQVVFEYDITINGITYHKQGVTGTDTATDKYGKSLADILEVINSSGGKYRLQAGSTANIIKLQSSTDGGSTWSDVTSITVNNVANATTATNVALSATGTGTNSITIKAGSGTAASFTVNNVAEATKAKQDGSGNVITTTYATKTELENVVAGKNAAYVIGDQILSSNNPFRELLRAKTAAQEHVIVTGSASATLEVLPLVNNIPTEIPITSLKVGDTIYVNDAGDYDWFIGSIESLENGTVLRFDCYSIEADSPSLSGYVVGTGLTANSIILGNGNSAVKTSEVTLSTTAIAANGTGVDTHVLTEKATQTTIQNHINALDVSNITGFGAGKTLATLTEANGKIAATFQDISITKSQISDFPTIPTISGTAPISASTSGGTTTITHNTSGATAGTYSAVTVNTYGHVTAGAQIIKYVSSVDADVSNVANGGTVIVIDSN